MLLLTALFRSRHIGTSAGRLTSLDALWEVGRTQEGTRIATGLGNVGWCRLSSFLRVTDILSLVVMVVGRASGVENSEE